MKQSIWFERKFPLVNEPSALPTIIERLEGTPLRLSSKVQGLTDFQLNFKPGDKWSVKEEIGHLSDLEPLWYGRVEDLLSGVEVIREADLSNQKTHQANHNARGIYQHLDQFSELRHRLVQKLRGLDMADLKLSSLHPRLKTPMTIVDLSFFVAEHDDHHLAHITRLILQSTVA